MGNLFTRKFRLNNPYRPDEQIVQEVSVVDELTLDYSQVPWVAIDTEFINLDLKNSLLCVVQIASPGANQDEQRVEVVYVREKIASGQDQQLKDQFRALLERTDLEMITHVATADLTRIEMFTDTTFKGKLFDNKAAARVAIPNYDKVGMDDLINQLIDPKFTKDKNVTMSQWDLNPNSWTDKMVEYAMCDVIYLNAIKNKLTEMAQRRGVSHVVDAAMAALPHICQLYKHGHEAKILEY